VTERTNRVITSARKKFRCRVSRTTQREIEMGKIEMLLVETRIRMKICRKSATGKTGEKLIRAGGVSLKKHRRGSAAHTTARGKDLTRKSVNYFSTEIKTKSLRNSQKDRAIADPVSSPIYFFVGYDLRRKGSRKYIQLWR